MTSLGHLQFENEKLSGATRRWFESSDAQSIKTWDAFWEAVISNLTETRVATVRLVCTTQTEPAYTRNLIALNVNGRVIEFQVFEEKKHAGKIVSIEESI